MDIRSDLEFIQWWIANASDANGIWLDDIPSCKQYHKNYFFNDLVDWLNINWDWAKWHIGFLHLRDDRVAFHFSGCMAHIIKGQNSRYDTVRDLMEELLNDYPKLADGRFTITS